MISVNIFLRGDDDKKVEEKSLLIAKAQASRNTIVYCDWRWHPDFLWYTWKIQTPSLGVVVTMPYYLLMRSKIQRRHLNELRRHYMAIYVECVILLNMT